MQDSVLYKTDTAFIENPLSNSKFLLKNIKTKETTEHFFGETVATKFGEINITPNLLNNIEVNI